MRPHKRILFAQLTPNAEFDLTDFKHWTFIHAQDLADAAERLTHSSCDVFLLQCEQLSSEDEQALERMTLLKPLLPKIVIVTGEAANSKQVPFFSQADAVIRAPVTTETLHFLVDKLAEEPSQRWNRKAMRFETELPLELFNQTKTLRLQAMVRNISEGGMFIALPEPRPFARNEVLIFQMSLPEEEFGSIVGRGAVRWIREGNFEGMPYGMGLEFVELKSGCQELVTSWIARLSEA